MALLDDISTDVSSYTSCNRVDSALPTVSTREKVAVTATHLTVRPPG